MIVLIVLGEIFIFLLGVLLGLSISFDWKAYYKHKTDVVELDMKYEKEARNEQSNISN